MSLRHRLVPALLLLSFSASACGDDGAGDGSGSGGSDDIGDATATDATADAGTDATATDATADTTTDATADTTTDATADTTTDATADTTDGGTTDTTTDGGTTDTTDGGTTDTTDGGTTDTTDGGTTDTTTDGGTTDTTTDGGSTDTTTGEPDTFDNCGFPEDGPWVQIEYWQLGSVSSPAWSYSDTPGWGEAEWAYQGDTWPEVWSIGNNSMSNDPIGIVADISGQWQLMIGLAGISSYDYATVCYEGRSISVGSSAIVDVYNPFNGCGVETQISNSWQVHAVGADLGDCFIPGNETQAVRLDPWGGSGRLGLKRMRLTLHGAVY